MKPVLYSFRRCPFAIRARIAIVMAGLSVELREIKLTDKPIAMTAVSPKATVPVLIQPDGSVLDESIDIIRWTTTQTPWCVPDVREDLVHENDREFKTWLDRYKYPDKHPDHDQAYYREKGMIFLRTLDRLLEESPFLAGDHVGFPDVAIFPFVRQFAAVDSTWFRASPFEKLKDWLQDRVSDPAFEKTMVQYPVWVEGSAPFDFPVLSWETNAAEVRQIVDSLCAELGLCAGSGLRQSLSDSPPAHPSFLLHRVFVAQGLVPDPSSDLFKRARELLPS